MMSTEITERDVTVNGVDLHVLDARAAGNGQVSGGSNGADNAARPLVVLCHGFPELSFSWRRQIPALVEAGYRVIAPDQRGYGRSGRPEAIEDYDIEHLTDDIIGLIDDAGVEQAVVVGHDWGANVAWGTAHRHPDRVAGVVGMSVPFLPRSSGPPTEIMRAIFADNFFYMIYFQEPGIADANLAGDTAGVLRGMLAGLTGTPSAESLGDLLGPADGRGFAERLPTTAPLPVWLSADDLDHYVSEFTRTGFTGGINWYRNIDRNWMLSEDLADVQLTVPALFIAGAGDPVLVMTPPAVMDGWVTDLRGTVLLEGAGHWVQQEKPDEVNAALIEFLGGVQPA